MYVSIYNQAIMRTAPDEAASSVFSKCLGLDLKTYIQEHLFVHNMPHNNKIEFYQLKFYYSTMSINVLP